MYTERDVEQQKCLAHYIQDLKEILYRLGRESEEMDKTITTQELLEAHLEAQEEDQGQKLEDKDQERPEDQEQMESLSSAQESSQDDPITPSPRRKRGRPKKPVDKPDS